MREPPPSLFSDSSLAESYRALARMDALALQARSEVESARAMLQKAVIESELALAQASEAMGKRCCSIT